MIQSDNLVTLFCVCMLAYTVYSENCTTTQNCKDSGITQCLTGYHVVCQHPDGGSVETNGGKCTCAVDIITCITQADCIALDLESYKCISDGHKHCYDNKCICSRW
ncbi:uncharacterized protein LOC132716001 isoform X3 [Ruditapes philippinarum]|uniref:uncharacterized protein LOC132716001 isoform X3 n=1 Tax=Ruditapes philippinarum TaxID=129788 RepID=UPI00295B8B10|nr:uncharacterized protein LOC132716001 isoform X3 [Ruditapes philippinarum]